LQCSRALEVYKKCFHADSWPCYPLEMQELQLPGWVRRKEQMMIID
jgi:hypothetical protein